MPQDSLLRLPNELLFHIARYLPRKGRYSWLLTCRLFHDLVIDHLYLDDILHGTDCRINGVPRSLHWGCSTGNLATLRRARRVGADPWRYSGILLEAISGADPAATVPYLLDNGADIHAHCINTFGAVPYRPDAWYIVRAVLDNCHLQSREWCPVPVLQALVDRGANLSTEYGLGGEVMGLWLRIFTLEHVTSSPRRRSTGTTVSAGTSHNSVTSPCAHSDPCRVATTRLLLSHGANPEISNTVHTLVTLAMAKLKRPLEIVECLADAGADLNRRFISCIREFYERPRYPGYYEVPIRWSHSRHDVVEPPAPIHIAAANAALLSSLARRPRQPGWDVYHDVTCPKAGEIVKFLLSRGVELDRRARTLLSKWEVKWMQWYVPRPYASAGNGHAADFRARPRG